MKISTKKLLPSIILSLAFTNGAFAEEEKYLCITEVSSGLVYKNGSWVSTKFKAGEKFLIGMKGGALISAKVFGAPEDLSMNSCHSISSTSSVCSDNFDSFRFQLSTKRFVTTKTSGYTNEYEEAGLNLSPLSFTPNISIGVCEPL